MKIINADCIAAMSEMPENSVDSIVTDPPYELGFMGKSWDSTGIAFNIEIWKEALRVLKPGGHLIAFSGSRTNHRMAVAIEDAGFQIRDQIMWVYGSGFPKSHDVSKAIDKSDAVEMRRQRDLKFTEWMRSTGITGKQINDSTQSNMGNHYLTDKEQPAVATAEMFDKIRPFLPEVPEWVEQMVRERTIESENFKKREVVGSKKSGIGTAFGDGEWASGQAQDVDITAPATAAAKQWQGWGTALKPAHEPMVLARKPVVGTVANNVLTYGTGGLNIDGSRVAHLSEADRASATPQGKVTSNKMAGSAPDVENEGRVDVERPDTSLGRFPANFIHDGSDEVLELLNEAARFFYCAKASKRDRNEGALNHHPTVKPTSLMQYLVRLVTPPNGIVLDPFMGSGSTGKACVLEGFDFIGIEQSAEYVEIARARIEYANDKRSINEDDK